MEIWPAKANANTNELELNPAINYGLVPLNEDGSIDVNLKSSSGYVDVNIMQVGGEWLGAYQIAEGGAYAIATSPTSDHPWK